MAAAAEKYHHYKDRKQFKSISAALRRYCNTIQVLYTHDVASIIATYCIGEQIICNNTNCSNSAWLTNSELEDAKQGKNALFYCYGIDHNKFRSFCTECIQNQAVGCEDKKCNHKDTELLPCIYGDDWDYCSKKVCHSHAKCSRCNAIMCGAHYRIMKEYENSSWFYWDYDAIRESHIAECFTCGTLFCITCIRKNIGKDMHFCQGLVCYKIQCAKCKKQTCSVHYGNRLCNKCTQCSQCWKDENKGWRFQDLHNWGGDFALVDFERYEPCYLEKCADFHGRRREYNDKKHQMGKKDRYHSKKQKVFKKKFKRKYRHERQRRKDKKRNSQSNRVWIKSLKQNMKHQIDKDFASIPY
eukprot:233254_1